MINRRNTKTNYASITKYKKHAAPFPPGNNNKKTLKKHHLTQPNLIACNLKQYNTDWNLNHQFLVHFVLKWHNIHNFLDGC